MNCYPLILRTTQRIRKSKSFLFVAPSPSVFVSLSLSYVVIIKQLYQGLMFSTKKNYLAAVQQRNKETFTDGHMVEFRYTEQQINDNKEYFERCRKQELSPYKALTFFYDHLNP